MWCVLTSNAPCPSPVSVTSNKVSITVNPVVTPTVSVSASQNPVCTGASVTFTATITNGGTPIYQWYKNGVTMGSTDLLIALVLLQATILFGWCSPRMRIALPQIRLPATR